jgi:hypothetical protein
MRLSELALLKEGLSTFKPESMSPLKAYPTVLGPKYKELWTSFVVRKSAQQILKACSTDQKKAFYLGQSFISFLHRQGLTDNSYRSDINLKILIPRLAQAAKYLKQDLDKFGLTTLKLVRSTYSVKPVVQLELIGAYFGIELEGHLVYKTKTGTLDQQLALLKDYLYKKELPVLLQANKRKLKQVIASDKALFYTLRHRNQDLNMWIKVARAQDQLIIRYEITVPTLLPYGTNRDIADRSLYRLWPKALNLT